MIDPISRYPPLKCEPAMPLTLHNYPPLESSVTNTVESSSTRFADGGMANFFHGLYTDCPSRRSFVIFLESFPVLTYYHFTDIYHTNDKTLLVHPLMLSLY